MKGAVFAIWVLLGVFAVKKCVASRKVPHISTEEDIAFPYFDFKDSNIDDNELGLVEEDSDDDSFEPQTYASGDDESGSDVACGSGKANTDEFVDKVLQEARSKIPEIARLPERTGRFKMYNGTLFGLPTLARTGPSMIRCSDSTFSFRVPVGLQNVSGGYLWQLETAFSALRPFRGSIDLTIRNVEADIFYTRDRTPSFMDVNDTRRARVERLTITRLDGVDVKFDGLGPLNRVASAFTNLVARVFRRGVSRALEGPVRRALNRELRNVEKYEMYYY